MYWVLKGVVDIWLVFCQINKELKKIMCQINKELKK